MESQPGELQYISEGSLDVCGLYLIGLPDQLVEIEFVEFNVHCETGGILAVSPILCAFWPSVSHVVLDLNLSFFAALSLLLHL